MISQMLVLTGRSEFASSSRIFFPILNSASHIFTVNEFRASYPSVETMSPLLSVGLKFVLQIFNDTTMLNFVYSEEESR